MLFVLVAIVENRRCYFFAAVLEQDVPVLEQDVPVLEPTVLVLDAAALYFSLLIH